MIEFNNYCFMPNKMVLIPKKFISKDLLIKINKKISDNDKYLKNESLLHEYLLKPFSAKKSLPISGGIAITENCQLRCNYCINESNEDNKSKTEIADVISFVNFLIKNVKIRQMFTKEKQELTLHLTGGGESTYNWNEFCEILEAVKSLIKSNNINAKLYMTTNGILTKEKVLYLIRNIDELMISFDGLPEVHDENRKFCNGTSSSDIVLNTLHILDEAKANYKIRTTMWHKDLHKMPEMAKFIYSNFNNFIDWSVNIISAEGRAKNYKIGIEDFSPQRSIMLYRETKKIINENYNKDNMYILNLASNSLCNIMCGAMKVESPWLYPNKKLKICVDGCDVSPVIGEISSGKIEFYQEYKNSLFEKYYERFISCHDHCLAYRFCAGGCPVKFLRKNTEVAEWECELIREYWKLIFDSMIVNEKLFGWCPKLVKGFEKYKVITFEKR